MNAPTHRLPAPRAPVLPTVLLGISTALLAALVALTACSATNAPPPPGAISTGATGTATPSPTAESTATPQPPVSVNITVTVPGGSVELPPGVPARGAAPSSPGSPSGLAVIPYTPTPPAATPIVTGIPYPAHCTAHVLAKGTLPDPVCTPGAVGDLVTQDTIDQTICVPNYTDELRPSTTTTNRVKTDAMAAYAVTAPRTRVELDHLVSLGLGGADDVRNLWPQVSDLPGNTVNNTKDQVERVLIKAVCARRVPLADAQRAIAQDWTTARSTLGI